MSRMNRMRQMSRVCIYFLCITSVHKIEIDLENIILYNIINYIWNYNGRHL
jgi:hypothetical protein